MFKRQNSKQKIMFRIIALGIIFALLPVQTCLARGRGKCKLAEEVGTGVAMNVLPGAIGLNSQYVTFNQVIMGHVAAPGISAGLAHAGLDDPLANAALTGFLSGGIKGGMLEGGGWQGAFTEGARWATAGATGNYLEQQGLHPGLANLGASAAGNFAGGAMQGILYEKAYNEAGNLKSDWAKKYGTRYELQDKDGHPLETLIEESSSQLRLVEVPRIAAT